MPVHAASCATSIANAYEEPSAYLYVRRLGEVHVVHSVHKVLCGDALATEETAVQALDRVLAALDTVKFDVDLAVSGTGSNTNVYNLPVVGVALFFDVLFKLLVPAGFLSASAQSQSESFVLRLRGNGLTLFLCTGS
jgi:hypothetical protein